MFECVLVMLHMCSFKSTRHWTSVLPFSKLNKMFFGYFDPENIFLDNKNKFFRGELTDNSAKKEALLDIR